MSKEVTVTFQGELGIELNVDRASGTVRIKRAEADSPAKPHEGATLRSINGKPVGRIETQGRVARTRGAPQGAGAAARAGARGAGGPGPARAGGARRARGVRQGRGRGRGRRERPGADAWTGLQPRRAAESKSFPRAHVLAVRPNGPAS